MLESQTELHLLPELATLTSVCDLCAITALTGNEVGKHMDKKYQVFISSTYLDLKNERQAVSKAILDLGHIPSGMELFPATNASQLDYIKKVIDDCDYYIVIVGGRYGALGTDGISYTEQEYNYAVQKGLPILAFIHEDIGEIRSKDTEKDEALANRLTKFREKLQEGRLTKYWTQLGDLQASVITSLTSEFRDNSQTGWRRDTGELSPEMIKKLDGVNKNAAFWRGLSIEAEAKVKSYEDLAQSVVEIRFFGGDGPSSARFTGEEIIREFAVPLSRGANSDEIQSRLLALVQHTREPTVSEIDPASTYNVELFFEVFEIVDEAQNLLGTLKIRDEKKYLLKAAFKPLSKVMQERALDEEIPF